MEIGLTFLLLIYYNFSKHRNSHSAFLSIIKFKGILFPLHQKKLSLILTYQHYLRLILTYQRCLHRRIHTLNDKKQFLILHYFQIHYVLVLFFHCITHQNYRQHQNYHHHYLNHRIHHQNNPSIIYSKNPDHNS